MFECCRAALQAVAGLPLCIASHDVRSVSHLLLIHFAIATSDEFNSYPQIKLLQMSFGFQHKRSHVIDSSCGTKVGRKENLAGTKLRLKFNIVHEGYAILLPKCQGSLNRRKVYARYTITVRHTPCFPRLPVANTE